MRILSVLLLLGLVVFACSEKCPSDEELKPCVCENMQFLGIISVHCNGLVTREELTLEDVKQSIKSLSGKHDIELLLKNVSLGRVPSTFFKGIGLRHLYISHCDLDSLSEGNEPILSGLEDSLEVLDIQGSFDENDDLTQLKFGHLKKLAKLRLSYNRIKEVSNTWFDKGPASVDRVYLHGNGIKELGDRAFADLPKLATLFVKGNSISSIKRAMLPSSADHLTNLYLDKNALASLPDDIFRDMPSLSTVTLTRNGITRINQDTWESIWEQLDHIDLNDNPLVCDSHMNWMIKSRSPSYIGGSCAAPETKKGTKLEDFINDKEQ